MRKHIEYYISFIFILSSGLFLVFQQAGNRQLQLEFVLLLATFYVLWGIVHHVIHHSISIKVISEYFVVALLGVAAVVFVMNGGL